MKQCPFLGTITLIEKLSVPNLPQNNIKISTIDCILENCMFYSVKDKKCMIVLFLEKNSSLVIGDKDEEKN